VHYYWWTRFEDRSSSAIVSNAPLSSLQRKRGSDEFGVVVYASEYKSRVGVEAIPEPLIPNNSLCVGVLLQTLIIVKLLD
jgi:hypothetical protein